MKFRLLLLVSVFLIYRPAAYAQINNLHTKPADSLEITSYNTLVNFISADTLTVRTTATEQDPNRHLGEEHLLITPNLTYPGTAAGMQGSMSYDNFLPTVHNKDATVGSPFLLTFYVPGLVINPYGVVFNKPDYLYNYDKKSGNLLLQRGTEKPIAVNKEQVKYFCLKEPKGGYIFERVSFISADEFFQVICKGSRYSVYKLYKNKFVSGKQTTNGYLTEGNNYDEYKDIISYYVIDFRKNEYYIFELKKNSIRKAFASDAERVNQYFKDHTILDIDDFYLTQMSIELNK